MALFEFHVHNHNHVDVTEILQGISKVSAGVDTLVALATATSDADKAAIVKAAKELDNTQSRVKSAVDANPVPT